MNTDENSFGFGIEAEYLLADATSFRPLWHQDVRFAALNHILESIDIGDLPPLDGLELEPPHRKLMPYLVEGYGVPDQDFRPVDVLAKGVEIRTPVCRSLPECLRVFSVLFTRLKTALARQANYAPVALSHHPLATTFHGPQNKRRHDFWQWAMRAMTTYGPDINVSFPKEVVERLELKDLNAKINFYSPAMTAFSLASPFLDGRPWRINEQIGKSVRTYKRSVIAPPIEIHLHEAGRFEFKVFEMTNRLNDFEAYFLLFLTLALDESLRGRAEDADRIYGMGRIAISGFTDPLARARAADLLAAAHRTLPAWGFDVACLNEFARRLDTNILPADRMLARYAEQGALEPVLRDLSELRESPVQSPAHVKCV
jgi:hypothetical protein